MDISPLWISLKTAIAATGLATVIGIAIAQWRVRYRGRWGWVVDGALTLPLVLPPVVVGFGLLLIFGRNSPVGWALRSLGVRFIFSWPALVSAATLVALPLVYRTVVTAFEQVDAEAIAGARTLGASEAQIFWQVLLPLAWPGVLAGMVLAFARSLGEFGATVMVAGSIPGRTVTIPIQIFLAAESGMTAVAIAWVAVAITVAVGAIALLNWLPGARRLAGAKWLYQQTQWLGGIFWGDRSNCALIKPDSQASCPALQASFVKRLGNFHLDLDLSAGETPLGILGASGSGKSLTLRCIAGVETPDAGQISVNGRVLFDAQRQIDLPPQQRRVGIIFQHYGLLPHLTVAENIAFGLQHLSTVDGDRPTQDQIQAQIRNMRLQGLEHRYPDQLSGGQQQRVALARAIAIQPDVLLLDEPLSALDTYLRHQIERLLRDIFAAYNGTVILVTHRLEEAFRLCENLTVLADGRVIARDRKDKIFTQPGSYQVAQLTECKNFSPARIVAPGCLEAIAWNCHLQVTQPIPNNVSHIGIRAHHLEFIDADIDADDKSTDNTCPCWLADISETQHRVTLLLKLHDEPGDRHDYHLQAEMPKPLWQEWRDRPAPWMIHLAADRLLPLTD
ncbi:MAG: molybdate ABC transporter permease subunit, partial [Cyanobacteria bacterium P01_D01_bin.73]